MSINPEQIKKFQELDYEGFKALAKDKSLSKYEKIGFPDEYRKDKETFIFNDIIEKVPLIKEKNKVILDIGPGCSEIPNFIIDLCRNNSHKLILNDSKEMLDLLPNETFIHKVEGFYPQTAFQISEILQGSKVDVIICYSVFHYIVFSNIWKFIDSSIELLNDGGQIIIGDIPNASKRKRFLASNNGKNFHKDFMNTDEDPVVNYNIVEQDKIDDSIMQAVLYRANLAGCDAYIVPQNPLLPMANRRDDILIRKP